MVYYKTGESQDGQTNDPSTPDTFSTCTCDLTPDACDHACCCDPKCEAAEKWRLEPGFCLDEKYDSAQLTSG